MNARIRRTSRPGRPTAFLLAGGTARCAECNTALWSSWANGKARYVCPSRTGAGGCGKVAISAEPFEEVVTRDVIKLITGPKFNKALKAAAGDDTARRKAGRELAAAEERKTEMAGDYADGTISRVEWMVARDRLDERIAAATKILAADTGPLAGLPTTKKALTETWDAAPLAWRRAVIDSCIDRVEVSRAVRVGARFDEGRVTIRLAGLDPHSPVRYVGGASELEFVGGRGLGPKRRTRGNSAVHGTRRNTKFPIVFVTEEVPSGSPLLIRSGCNAPGDRWSERGRRR